MALGKVDVVIVSFAYDGDTGFHVFIAEPDLILVNSSFLWYEVEDNLFRLANLEDTFTLVHLEVLRNSDSPLGGLLANVANDDWLLGFVLYGNQAEIERVGEV